MNFTIKNQYWAEVADLEPALFGEPVEYLAPDADMYDVLVKAGVFISKGQARKNWKQTGAEIPEGFALYTVGKQRKTLAVWLPIKDSCTAP